jgi:hypothetical protein
MEGTLNINSESDLITEIPPKTEEIKYYIYVLIDPRTKQPFYVGKSTNVLARICQHMCATTRLNSRSPNVSGPKLKIIFELRNAWLMPEYEILESTTKELANEKERLWLDKYKNLYGDLITNSKEKGRHKLKNIK